MSRSWTFAVQAATSLDALLMGWMRVLVWELTYIQDLGLDASSMSPGVDTIRCQPECSKGALVQGLIGGSCIAKNEKLVMHGSLINEFITDGALLQFSCRIATESGILMTS